MNDQNISARTSTGEPVDVVDAAHQPSAMEGAAVSLGADVVSDENIKNPLNEETIRVRVKPGVEFFHQGDLVREGDEFDMAVSIAQNAAQFITPVNAQDRKKLSQPTGPTSTVPRADLSTLTARHERVGALEAELQALNARRDAVTKQLETEKAQMTDEVSRRRAGAGGQVYAPGVTGGHGNAAVPPRPGEPTVVTTNNQAIPTPGGNPGPVAGAEDVKGSVKR